MIPTVNVAKDNWKELTMSYPRIATQVSSTQRRQAPCIRCSPRCWFHVGFSGSQHWVWTQSVLHGRQWFDHSPRHAAQQVVGWSHVLSISGPSCPFSQNPQTSCTLWTAQCPPGPEGFAPRGTPEMMKQYINVPRTLLSSSKAPVRLPKTDGTPQLCFGWPLSTRSPWPCRVVA